MPHFAPAATCRYRTETPYTYHYVKSATCTDVQNGCCYLATRFDRCFDQIALGGKTNKLTFTNVAAVNCFTASSGGSNVAWTKLSSSATYSTVSTCGSSFPTYTQQLLTATINTGFGTCTANKPDNTNSGGSFGPVGCPSMTDLHFIDPKCKGYTVGCMLGIANLVSRCCTSQAGDMMFNNAEHFLNCPRHQQSPYCIRSRVSPLFCRCWTVPQRPPATASARPTPSRRA